MYFWRTCRVRHPARQDQADANISVQCVILSLWQEVAVFQREDKMLALVQCLVEVLTKAGGWTAIETSLVGSSDTCYTVATLFMFIFCMDESRTEVKVLLLWQLAHNICTSIHWAGTQVLHASLVT